jgi:serine/threonine protein phosphatase 1
LPSRVIAIGDIHGCAKALRALLESVRPQPDDTLVVLGDCVDRGPNSREVIEELLALRQQCRVVPLLGNHEEMMLNFLDGKPQPDNWLEVGGVATIRSYSSKSDPDDVTPAHVEYIRTWGDFYETSSHFFVHASYEPEQPLARQHSLTLRWHSLRDWIPEPHVSGKTAVVGHTSQKDGEILNAGHLICIDTCCWGGGWLTALDTNSGHVWQANRDGCQRSGVDALQPAKPA